MSIKRTSKSNKLFRAQMLGTATSRRDIEGLETVERDLGKGAVAFKLGSDGFQTLFQKIAEQNSTAKDTQ